MSEVIKTINPNIELLMQKPEGNFPLQRIITFKNPKNAIKTTSQHVAYIYPEPFYNCQTGSIAAMNQILCYNKEEQEDFLLAAWGVACGKNQLMVDIPSNYSAKMEALFTKSEIIFKQAYTSTRGSSMVVYLVRIKRALGRIRQERIEKDKKEKQLTEELKAKAVVEEPINA